MKGATVELCAKIIKVPSSNSTSMMGINQYFFLALMKNHKSDINSNIFKMDFLMNFDRFIFEY